MDEVHQQSDRRITGISSFLVSHPAIIVSFIYVYVSAIGFIYSAFLLMQFGINIAEFAKTSDFLLAAFKSPRTLLLGVGGALLLGLYGAGRYHLKYYLARKAVELIPKDGTSTSRWKRLILRSARAYGSWLVSKACRRITVFFLAITTLLYPLLFVPFVALRDSDAILYGNNGDRHLVRVSCKQNAVNTEKVDLPEQVLLITTTDKFAFFHYSAKTCEETSRTFAMPLENTAIIEILPPD